MSEALSQFLGACARGEQSKWAREWGVNRVTVSRWKNGKRKVARRLVPVIAKTTGIPAAKIRPDLAKLLEAAE